MSFILVAESDTPTSDRVRDALEAGGWNVRNVTGRSEAVDLASKEVPDLVLVGAGLPEARRLLSEFSWLQGGPGSVLIVSVNQEEKGLTPVADATIKAPFEDEELRATVQQCLDRETGNEEKGLDELMGGQAPGAQEEFQLTSDDLFSDLVDEVESDGEEEAEKEAEKEAAAAPPVSVMADLTASLTQPLKIMKASAKPAADSAREQEDQLEKTLSGFLSDSLPKPKKKLEDTSGGSVDALLSRTLSGLELPSKARKSVAPVSSAATQRIDTSKIREMLDAEAAALESSKAEEKAETEQVAEDSPIEEPIPAPVEEEAIPGLQPEAEEPQPEAEAEADADIEAQPDLEVEEEPEPELTPPPPVEEKPAPRAVAASKPAVEEGRQFGQYTLLDKIALGGMAEVWRARMKGVEGFQKTVAIKKILPHLTDSSDFVTMFIDEAKLAAQLNHNNIVHIYDLGKIEDDFYIAMEFVDGRDLRTILNYARREGQPLPMGLALMVAAGLASGLDHAHHRRDFENRELGLVHRDVSPQNVLISYSGDIKLCDFGIVKAVAKASKTQMGALKGKLQYMSPEQAWGRTVDARSDIFSLGSVLFEMLAGRRLFSGESEISVLEAVRECRIQAPREIDERIPMEVNLLTLKALEKDPDDRFQTAGEMHEEIKKILFSLQTTPSQSDLGGYMQKLFQVEPTEVASGEEKAPRVEPKVEKPSIQVPAEAVAPKSGVLVEETGSKNRKGLMIGIAAAALIGIVLIIWAISRGMDQPPEGRETAPPTQTEVAQPVPAVATPESEPTKETEESADKVDLASEAASDTAPSSVAEPTTVEPPSKAEEKPAPVVQAEESQTPPATVDETPVATEPEVEPEPADEPEQEEPAFDSVVAGGEGETKAEADAIEQDPAETAADTLEDTAGAQAEDLAQEATVAEEETTPPPVEEERPPPPPPLVAPQQTAPAQTEKPVQRGDLVELGPGVVQPKRIRRDKIRYPPQAKRLRAEGTVILKVLVNEEGRVEDVQVLRGVKPESSGINGAAVKAAKSSRFEAATKDGVAVKMWITQTIPFKL